MQIDRIKYKCAASRTEPHTNRGLPNNIEGVGRRLAGRKSASRPPALGPDLENLDRTVPVILPSLTRSTCSLLGEKPKRLLIQSTMRLILYSVPPSRAAMISAVPGLLPAFAWTRMIPSRE